MRLAARLSALAPGASLRWPLAAVLLFGLAVSTAPAEHRAECLACHSDNSLKDAAGRSIYVDGTKQQASVHGSLDCTDCHASITGYPHPKKIARVDCSSCHPGEAGSVEKSVHGAILGKDACASCHGDPHDVRPPGKVAGKECESCHADVIREFQGSIHGRPGPAGSAPIATCQSCHGPAHDLLSHSDPASPVEKKNLAATCGSCHANPQYLAQHSIPFAKPVEAYRLSVHGRAVAAGREDAATCSDCHGVHTILPARDPASKVNHWNVPQTCGACHTKIRDVYLESIHGQAVARGVREAPVCTDCHGEHDILAPGEPQSLVNPLRVSVVTCGRCHADEQLAQKYGLPLDKVPAYEESYHGLALREGSQTVANCASCHGVHNIFPSSDPRSTVNPANLAHTCGACHPGAGTTFAIGPVHVLPGSASEHPVVKWIRRVYWILIPLTLIFMLFHNAVDFLAKLVRRAPRVETGKQVLRMNLQFRIEHWLLVISFSVLVCTGFALKFPDAWWASPILHWESRIAFRGMLHRAAAIVLLASLAAHIIHLVVSRRDRVILHQMVPRLRDLGDLRDMLLYNLGFGSRRPHFGKFSYAEKLEYLAFFWGMAIMTPTGFLLWFNNFTLRHFPKWVADGATALHYYEAILATLAIVVWHFYMTVLDPDVYPMDMAWLTGKASADHLQETRPEYCRELLKEPEAADADAKDPPAGPDQS